MKKKKTQKMLQWGTRDYVTNAIVYVANFFVIAGLFIAAIWFNGKDFYDFFSNATSFLHFVTLLMLVLGVMALYFIFEERDFMKNAVNSEMLFLILELSLIICFLAGEYVTPYLRPLALVSVLTLFLTNRRTAIFMNVIFCITIKQMKRHLTFIKLYRSWTIHHLTKTSVQTIKYALWNGSNVIGEHT